MAYELGTRSLEKLRGVHPRLVAVVKRAIALTRQDFMVTDGLRTAEQQRILVQKGASKTMLSKHLKQRDGWGHAVDLVPYINGGPRWEAEPCFAVATAVHQAADELLVELTWGCAWDVPFGGLESGVAGMKKAVEAYKKRHPGPDFLDFPHYQIR